MSVLDIDRRVLARRAELAMANYRHAWDYGTDEECERAFVVACQATAALKAYDAIREHRRLHVDMQQYDQLSRAIAVDDYHRRSIEFPRRK